MNEQIKKEVTDAIEELLEVANLEEGEIFLIGCSTSEVIGQHIGKATTLEIGELIIETAKEILDRRNIFLAVQCCEHLNRAIVVDKELIQKYSMEEVNVVPQPNAGGGAATAAYRAFDNPTVVEKIIAHAGLDIGDTSIGMHIKHVQVPVRLRTKQIGQAHLSALRHRLKMIGGQRAVYK